MLRRFLNMALVNLESSKRVEQGAEGADPVCSALHPPSSASSTSNDGRPSSSASDPAVEEGRGVEAMLGGASLPRWRWRWLRRSSRASTRVGGPEGFGHARLSDLSAPIYKVRMPADEISGFIDGVDRSSATSAPSATTRSPFSG